MINNILVIDRPHYDEITTKSRSFLLLAVLSYVVVREMDDTYTIIKNRHSGEMSSYITKDKLLEIAKDWRTVT